MSPELAAATHHEAGHAVATVQAFLEAAWLPRSRPRLPVRSIEIVESTPGQWGGCCTSLDIYSMR